MIIYRSLNKQTQRDTNTHAQTYRQLVGRFGRSISQSVSQTDTHTQLHRQTDSVEKYLPVLAWVRHSHHHSTCFYPYVVPSSRKQTKVHSIYIPVVMETILASSWVTKCTCTHVVIKHLYVHVTYTCTCMYVHVHVYILICIKGWCNPYYSTMYM